MKYFYMCVAEFEAEPLLEEFPTVYFPNIKEGSLKCKHSIESVENKPFKFYEKIIKNPLKYIKIL